jgi:hypothetical protein
MLRRRLAIVLVPLALAAACGGGGDDDGAGAGPAKSSTTTTAAAAQSGAAALCARAEPVGSPPNVAAADLPEGSGIATSRANDGIVWSHNDSGGQPEVFAIGEDDGADRGRWKLAGATAVDWEDIARGPGPGGSDMLYVADIGDNLAARASVTVYRAPEPRVGPGKAGGTIDGVLALTLRYADGPHDAEALLADPVSGDLVIVTKTPDGTSGAYPIPEGAAPGRTITLQRAAAVAVPKGQLVTSGDVSPDGSLIALRTYRKILVWDRAEGQPVAEALTGRPCEAPAPTERQGEALAFMPDGKGYVTLSEGKNQPINRFHLP